MFIVVTVISHLVDKEQRQHLHIQALLLQVTLLLEVLFHRLADLLFEYIVMDAVFLLLRLQSRVIGKAHIFRAGLRVYLIHHIALITGMVGVVGQVRALLKLDGLFLGAVRRIFENHHRGRRCLGFAAVANLTQLQVSLVHIALGLDGRHRDLLHQLHVVSFHRAELVHHVVGVAVGGGITQGEQWLQVIHRPAGLGSVIHRLRLVDDQHRPHVLDEFDGLDARHPVLLPVNHRELLDLLRRQAVVTVHIPGVPLKRLDVDHHNLQRVGGGKLADLGQIFGAVYVMIERRVVVKAAEVFLHHGQRRQHALPDGHRRHYNNEFAKAQALVQFEYAAQVHVGFTGAGFHLHREIGERVVIPCFKQMWGFLNEILLLHPVQVIQQFVRVQCQGVGDAQLAIGFTSGGQALEHRQRGFDSVLLVIEIGVELQFQCAAPASSAGFRYCIRSPRRNVAESCCNDISLSPYRAISASEI